MISVYLPTAIWIFLVAIRLLAGDVKYFCDICLTCIFFLNVPPPLIPIYGGVWKSDSFDYRIFLLYIFSPSLGFLCGHLGQKIKYYWILIWNGINQEVFTNRNSHVTQPFKPLFFPARTSHTRLFPKQHSFSYSYLLLGIPIGWEGYAGGSFFSVDTSCSRGSSVYRSRNARGWFNIENEDYLQTGYCTNLKEKLDDYLKGQGKKFDDFASAYLVTAPRFLGYSFNPVSFWYLYDHKHILRALIVEVNNTFGERRIYFLERSNNDSCAGENPEQNEIKEKQETGRLVEKWQKDFHVSPFNSRKGSYSIVAHDPFSKAPLSPAISNTITLSSSKHHPKLVARIVSTSEAIDPAALSFTAKLKFVLAWWWVGLVTFPRILKEAAKLFWKRRLHVWFRPEILQGSLARKFTLEEEIIESCFRPWLAEIMKDNKQGYQLKYITPEKIIVDWIDPKKGIKGEIKKSDIFGAFPTKKDEDKVGPTMIELEIITPQFYSDLALASDQSSFFKNAFNRANTDAQVVRCSKPAAFLALLEQNDIPKLCAFWGNHWVWDAKQCRSAWFKTRLSGRHFFGAPVALLEWLDWSIRILSYLIAGYAWRKVIYFHLTQGVSEVHHPYLERLKEVLGTALGAGARRYESSTLSSSELGTSFITSLTLRICMPHLWWALGAFVEHTVMDGVKDGG